MTINLSDISIRSYSDDDLAVVLQSPKDLYEKECNYLPGPFGKVVSDGLDALVATDGAMLWIAEYRVGNDVPVWAGSVVIVPTETTARLRFMLVDPSFRSCGLGRRLMDVAMDYCREKKYKLATLSTTSDCVSAHRLYERYGFKVVSVTEGTVWGAKTDEWWEKKLD
jgi:ribosomal protein S18 acetylase RimI-like enzyme